MQSRSEKGMTLYRRNDNSYFYYKFQFEGRSIRRSTGTKNRELAEQVEAKHKRDLWAESKLGEKPSHTWDQAVAEYMRVMPPSRNRIDTRTTLKWLSKHLSGRVLPSITRGELVRIRNAKIADINARKSKLAAAGRPSRWPSAQPSTVNRVMGVVGAVLNYAVSELEWLDKPLKVPKLKVAPSDPTWASRAQVLELIRLLPEHQKRMVILDIETGWRAGNLTRLEWAQIDMERRFAWVSAEAAKAGRGIPTPLSDVAMEVLEAQVGKHPQWVFPYRGRPQRTVCTRAFRRARDAAGLPASFVWHSIRHSWASWHVQDGTPLNILKELGGWTTERMVSRYGHLSAEHLVPYVRRRTGLPVDVVQAFLGGDRAESTTDRALGSGPSDARDSDDV